MLKKKKDTIKSLERKKVKIRPGKVIVESSDLARENYRAFLDLVTDDPELRAEAMRRLGDLELEATETDLENQPWPFVARSFDGIVMCNDLHRPLFPRLIDTLANGGVLLIDTFAVGNERFGRPRNPDFLLRPGELIDEFCIALNVKAYASGKVVTPNPAVRQSICAVRET